MANVVVDDSALKQLGKDIERGKRVLIGRLAERGYHLLRAEIKKTAFATGNLNQGVAPPGVEVSTGRIVTKSENKQGETYVDYDELIGQLTVSARSGRTGAGVAEVFGADGKKNKTVSLRPQPGYNYAATVAQGHKMATMTPSVAKAFLIPIVTNFDERTGKKIGYLMIGGEMYRLVRKKKGMKANPFDERAAKRLGEQSERIADGVLRDIVG